MKKIESLIELGLITVDDVWNYVSEMDQQAQMEEMIADRNYTQADHEMDQAHNEVLPF